MAIHICEPDGSKPAELRFYIEELVRPVFGFNVLAQGGEELCVQARSGRRNVVQIAKDATGLDSSKRLFLERPFAFVSQVVNGETRNDGIKFTDIGKRLVEIVFAYGNPRIARETTASAYQHGRRKIDGDSRRLWETLQCECQQPAVAAA